MKKEHHKIPPDGLDKEDILSIIRERKLKDAKWEEGRMFGYVYFAGREAEELSEEISRTYVHENALNPALFPSLAQFEREIVAISLDLLHGGDRSAGSVTSGGTESILMAMKSARDQMAGRKDLKDMEVILPRSVHPAFHKAAHYLGLKTVTLPLADDYLADVRKLPSLLNERTILLVGSAPSYSHGVIDPIRELGRIAKENDVLFHVDACLGGFFLPFMKKLGYLVDPFDLSVEGVTSISADLHKYGYSAKGVSVILYNDKDLWRDQFFVHCDWPGGFFGSPAFAGTRSGAPLVTAWAMLNYYGERGYLQMTQATMEAVEKIQKGISEMEGLKVAGDPAMSILSFTSDRNDIFRIGDEMQAKGWSLDRISDPPALHLVVTHHNIPMIGKFLEDLEDSAGLARRKKWSRITSRMTGTIAEKLLHVYPGFTAHALGRMVARSAKKTPGKKRTNSAAFYGIAASIGNNTTADEIVLDFIENIYSSGK